MIDTEISINVIILLITTILNALALLQPFNRCNYHFRCAFFSYVMWVYFISKWPILFHTNDATTWWQQYTNPKTPTMHLSHIRQYTIQNRNVHITVLNGVLWGIGQVHYCSEWCIVGYWTGALWDCEVSLLHAINIPNNDIEMILTTSLGSPDRQMYPSLRRWFYWHLTIWKTNVSRSLKSM